MGSFYDDGCSQWGPLVIHDRILISILFFYIIFRIILKKYIYIYGWSLNHSTEKFSKCKVILKRGGVSNQFFQGAMGNWDYYILLYVFSLLLPHAHCLLSVFSSKRKSTVWFLFTNEWKSLITISSTSLFDWLCRRCSYFSTNLQECQYQLLVIILSQQNDSDFYTAAA